MLLVAVFLGDCFFAAVLAGAFFTTRFFGAAFLGRVLFLIATVVADRAVHAEERLGINVETMDAELAQMWRFERARGVLLTQVARGSPADRRRLGGYIGQRLVQVQDRVIETPDDVRMALDDVGGDQIVSLHFEDNTGDVRVVNVRMPN